MTEPAQPRPTHEGDPTAQPDPGSFRDPTNRVFLHEDRVLRGLDETAARDFASLRASGFFARAVEQRQLVATELLDAPPAALEQAGWAAVLEHERIPVVTYPYEWPFAMLRDAALLQLDLPLAALDEGLTTKDATPYNVQFVGARPTHIDLGSFERLSPGEPWFGYRQFCQQFLYPLLLTARRGVPHQPLLRGSVRGVTPQTCAACLRWWDLARPSLFIHVALQSLAERRKTDAGPDGHDVRAELKSAGYGPAVIRGQLRKLRKLVERLEWKQTRSVWSEYSDRQHYDPEDLRAKEELVRRVAGERPRRQVLDLGANDGHFSRIALESAEYVVAVDHDPLVVDRLYRQLSEQGEERILPLVMDLADPSGGLGWRARERSPFVARVRPDLVLCLALVHHLAISESIPLDEVVAFLAEFSSEVILEFPTPEDPMVALLMAQKKDRAVPADRYGVDALERALATRFDTRLRTERGTRLLYDLVPRGRGQPIEVHATASAQPVPDGETRPSGP
ncbi:methyltransferase [Egicoccus sp. AB-alg2]|uniref:methyltransferase n=1 Tax=Egicoccus sp. AB-alg2 TaxID=3242693 RepID=UPI00359EA4DC